jgi:tetratricopeptide (TPR) repeat protein
MTRLLVIAAPGLDLAGFEGGARGGGLPALAALRARGVAGGLWGAPLSLGPAALATLATGVQPEVHGVWRDQEEWPGGLRRTGRASWRASPVWARLEAAGVSTSSVGWPALAPGRDWAGVHIDDRFCDMTGKTAADWALPRGCLPDDLRDALRLRRVHISQVGGESLARFVPGVDAAALARDDALATLAMGLARAATAQAAAVWLLGEARPDAVFVHHPWLGHVRHAFAARPGPMFAEVIPAGWHFLDALIGALAGLAAPEALVLVVSPGWAGAPGVALAAGPGVSPDGDFPGAGLIDIAPTVLARFGLEDAALPGRPLWRDDGARASAPAAAIPPPIAPDSEVAERLRAQGYPPPPPAGAAWRAQGLAELALMMLDRDPSGAVTAADAALALSPGEAIALQIKARAHVALGQADPLPALGDALMAASPERGWGALAHAACHVIRGERALAARWLTRAEADDDVPCLLTTAAVWRAAGRPAAAQRIFLRVLTIDPANVAAAIGVAMGEIARRDFLGAERRLVEAMKRDPGRPAICLQLAQCYARSGRKVEAGRAADRALRLGVHPSLAAAARAGRLKG